MFEVRRVELARSEQHDRRVFDGSGRDITQIGKKLGAVMVHGQHPVFPEQSRKDAGHQHPVLQYIRDA